MDKIILLDNCINHITISRMLPYWNMMGYKITTNENNKYDVMLSYVRFGIKSTKPKILRLDGIYYNTEDNYQMRNLDISRSHSVADGIIYQSEYSKKLILSLLAKSKNNSINSVIYNGIDTKWYKQFKKHDDFNIIITGKHRRHKRLKEIIDLFLEFNLKNKKSNLHIFGKLHDNREIKHPNIKYYGHVDRNEMLDILSISDLSIHLSKRDSCPNSVVEYIGAGIPTITTNNCGGATEMCKLTKGCIIVDGDGDYNDIKPVPHYSESWNILNTDLKHNILKSMKEIEKDRRRVVLPEQLTAEYTAKKYIQLMEEIR